MRGRVHSLESFGTVDGPGVRFVVFMQGCPLRCLYCHNPDTWTADGGKEYEVQEILALYKKNEAFYRNGGLTVTGGEPLWQIDFVTELFTAARKEGIHTCLDTSGVTFSSDNQAMKDKIDCLLAVTSLVMLDFKHIDDQAHRKLTGRSNRDILAFAQYIDAQNVSILARHVIVPGITDDAQEQYRLGHFLGTLKNLKALDALPYHNMGEVKYENLGMAYPLKGVPPLDPAKAVAARNHILHGIRDQRSGFHTEPPK